MNPLAHRFHGYVLIEVTFPIVATVVGTCAHAQLNLAMLTSPPLEAPALRKFVLFKTAYSTTSTKIDAWVLVDDFFTKSTMKASCAPNGKKRVSD